MANWGGFQEDKTMVRVAMSQMGNFLFRQEVPPVKVDKEPVNSFLNKAADVTFICPGKSWPREAQVYHVTPV